MPYGLAASQPGRFTPGGPVARAVARRALRWVPGSPAGHAWPAQRLGGDRSPPPQWWLGSEPIGADTSEAGGV